MRICVIGAGIAGLGIAHDLALEGIECIVVEKSTPGGGTTTHCAGMLHSGARYVLKNPALAKECIKANKELNETVPFAISKNKGLFVCLETDPPDYARRFATACEEHDISVKRLSREEAIELEPGLGPMVSEAFLTPDGVIDPFSLVEAHVERLEELGGAIWCFHYIVKAHKRPNGWQLQAEDLQNKKTRTIDVDMIINAAGPWASEVARVFGVSLPLTYLHGTMVVLKKKMVNSIVTRCARASAGDVVAPADNVCLAASTSRQLFHNKMGEANEQDIHAILKTASGMIPGITRELVAYAFMGIRVHELNQSDKNQRGFDIPRDVTVIDHSQRDGIPGLITALGGKLILYGVVAKLVGKLVRKQLGVPYSCQTRKIPLKPPHNPSGYNLGHKHIWNR